MVIKKFNCPICNAGCGLLIEVECNRIVKIKPDPDYPLTHGYCCPKGIALGSVTNDPDRIRRPLKRVDGKFVKISWKNAIHEIATKLNTVRAKGDPNAIAYYLGTNSLHQYAHSMFAVGFMDAIGSKNMFNAGSVDNNNKFVAQNFLYGSSVVMTIPDLPETDLLILIGTNPAVTNLSLVTCSNVMKHLKSIKKRGGEIYIIDPRRNETAKILTDKNDEYHVPIYPDTDIYMLLAMVNIIIEEGLVDQEYIKKNAKRFQELKNAIKGYTPEMAEKCCGISKDKIIEIAREFATTKKAVIYARLGTCLAQFASLNAWAVEILNILTGKLDQPGGTVFGKNIINISKIGKLFGMGSFNSHRSRIGDFPDVMGAFPLGILAREILADNNPVKALIVSGGNPFLSAPNTNEFKNALKKLDLCVVLDYYMSETAAYSADYILPTRTPMENSNTPIYSLNYQVFPHIEYSPAVVKTSRHGPKPEWEILLAIVRKMGVSLFGNKVLDLIPKIYSILHQKFHPEILIKLFLFIGQVFEKRFPKLSSNTFTLKKIKRSGTILLGNNEYNVLDKFIQTKDKKIPLINSHLIQQLQKCRELYSKKHEVINQVKSNPSEFLMIGRRNLKAMNSWMHNVEFLWRKRQEPHLFINPEDAEQLNFNNNEQVLVENELGSIKVPIKITDEVMPSVVCYPHGWGHKNPHLKFANEHPGENINVLTNSHKLDDLSGQPVMNGYKVELKKL